MLKEYQNYYETLPQVRPPENLQEENIEQEINIKCHKVIDGSKIERQKITQEVKNESTKCRAANLDIDQDGKHNS